MFLNSIIYCIKSNKYFCISQLLHQWVPDLYIYLIKHTDIVDVFYVFIYIHFIIVILYMDMTIVLNKTLFTVFMLIPLNIMQCIVSN